MSNCSTDAGPIGLVDLQALARCALEATHADGLLILDEHGPEPSVALSAGLATSDLIRAVEESKPTGWTQRVGDVTHRVSGQRWIISSRLSPDRLAVTGAIYLIYRDGRSASDSEQLRALVQAFASHAGFLLGCVQAGDVGRQRPIQGLLPWEDLLHQQCALEQLNSWVAEVMARLTGASTVGITIWDEERSVLRALPGAFGATDDDMSASVTGPPTNLCSVAARVLQSGQPYLSNCARGDPGILQQYVKAFQIRRLLSLPLQNGARPIGVLHLANKSTEFDYADLTAALSVSRRIATAIEVACSIGQMASRRRLQEILADTAIAITSGHDVNRCVVRALDHLGDALGASLVALIPAGSTALIRRVRACIPDLEVRLLLGARRGMSSSGGYPQGAGDPGWAALHAPVESFGEAAATLSVLRCDGQSFTVEEEEAVSKLANLVALACSRERYQRQLAQVARLRERERIADELHDHVNQLLYAARIRLETVLEGSSEVTDSSGLADVRSLLIEGDEAIRKVIRRLAVQHHPTFSGRLRTEIDSVERRFCVVVSTYIPDDEALGTVADVVGDAIVKVVREGTVNAAKHAGPCRIEVRVRLPNPASIEVSVSDDGHGFAQAPDLRPGLGMSSLRRVIGEAGGQLVVTRPASGFGLSLIATFPREAEVNA